MFGSNKDYQFFIIILVSAIIISLIFHIFFRQDTEANFSEIYFPEPDKLPNEAFLGEKYNFTFLIKNNENKPSTYEYTSRLELFNLYDVTEGTYRCVAEQRRKVILEWEQSNESENTQIIYSKSDDYGSTNWQDYNIEYTFENILGSGSFTSYFHDGENIKYSFTVFDDNSEVEFRYKEGNSTKYEKKKIGALRPNYEVLINASGGIKYYINNNLLFSKNLSNLTNGKMDFSMNNSYVLVGRLVVYKDSRVEVTKPTYIREYDIDNSLIIGKVEEFRKNSEEEFYLIRNFMNFSTECNEESCVNLKLFLNNPKNLYSFDTNFSLKNINTLALLNVSQDVSLPSYSILKNSRTPSLFWPNYTLKLDFQIFVKPHTFLLSLDNKIMLVLHNTYIYLIVKDDSKTTIHRRQSPVEIGANEITIESKDYNNIVYINQVPLINVKKEINFNDISLHTKNTFMVFDDIFISNKDPKCDIRSISKNCKRTYRVPSERGALSREQTRVVAEPIKLSAGLGAAPFLAVGNIFDIEPQTTLSNESAAQKPSVAQLLDYEIEINRSLINDNIPSEKYVFDGRNARLNSQINYSFGFNFHVLEGIRLIEVSFYNNDKTEISKFIINQPVNEAYLFTNSRGSLVKNTAKINISRYEGYKFEQDFEPNKTKYYLDNKKIFEAEGIDMSTGFFSIATYNTYADINDIRLYGKSARRFVPYSVNTDPCKLRKISEIALGKNYLYLDNNENQTIQQSFTVNQDFDYGLVSASLKQEGRNESEIHFWVVRSD